MQYVPPFTSWSLIPWVGKCASQSFVYIPCKGVQMWLMNKFRGVCPPAWVHAPPTEIHSCLSSLLSQTIPNNLGWGNGSTHILSKTLVDCGSSIEPPVKVVSEIITLLFKGDQGSGKRWDIQTILSLPCFRDKYPVDQDGWRWVRRPFDGDQLCCVEAQGPEEKGPRGQPVHQPSHRSCTHPLAGLRN